MKVVSIFLFVFLLNFVAAAECPFGEVDEPYPGTCGRYVDQNSDGLCDLSQDDLSETSSVDLGVQEEELKELINGQDLKLKTVQEISDIYGVNSQEYATLLTNYYNTQINPTDSFQYLHDEYNVAPSVAKDIVVGLVLGNSYEKPATKKSHKYPFVLIALPTIILYAISFILWKKKKITVLLHKQIWNLVLLVSFLVSAILGIILILRINYGWFTGFNIMTLHVDFGIVMALVSIFHTLEHIPFWKSYFK